MFYPVGDIHGRYDCLVGLYNKIMERIKENPDILGDTIVFLGDYIDRGPQSKQVLDFLMSLGNSDIVKHVILMGNHELMMIDARFNENYETERDASLWLSNGGDETLKSFGLTFDQFRNGEADEYVNWVSNLEMIREEFDYIFVHAAVETDTDGRNVVFDQDTFLWGRHKPNYRRLGKIVVHGHVVKAKGPLFLMENNEIFMDVGCGFSFVNRLATVPLPIYYDGESFEVINYYA